MLDYLGSITLSTISIINNVEFIGISLYMAFFKEDLLLPRNFEKIPALSVQKKMQKTESSHKFFFYVFSFKTVSIDLNILKKAFLIYVEVL